jgi:hypothetical protein
MSRVLKTILKIFLIFLFFYVLVAFIESVFNIEVEPYMIYMLFIMVASTVGWTVKKQNIK